MAFPICGYLNTSKSLQSLFLSSVFEYLSRKNENRSVIVQHCPAFLPVRLPGFSIWFFNGGYYRHYPNLYRQFGSYYRNNLVANRFMGSVNRGFMGVATVIFTQMPED
jgi:hypothetical protein